jgi:hypothetical protein
MHQEDDPFYVFPIDHVIAGQHDGPTIASNLALSCLRCNLHKGPNIAGRDPLTKKLTPLFHPRRHKRGLSLSICRAHIVGLTAIGRTTVKVLAMNHPDVVALRKALINERRK